jgi:hypothetical protein
MISRVSDELGVWSMEPLDVQACVAGEPRAGFEQDMSAPTTLRKSGRLADACRPGSLTEPHPLQRREFLTLPLRRRRKILKAQAAAALPHYAESTEWREWEAAALTGPADE